MKFVSTLLVGVLLSTTVFANEVQCIVMDDNRTDLVRETLKNDEATLDKKSSVGVRVVAEVSEGLLKLATVIDSSGAQAIAGTVHGAQELKVSLYKNRRDGVTVICSVKD